jgi:hypothetical protein
MHAGDAPALLAGLGDGGDRNRGRVGGKDGVLGDDGLERTEDLALGLEILVDRLEDNAARRQRGDVARQHQPGFRCRHAIGCGLALLDEAVEPGEKAGARFIQLGRIGVGEAHGEPARQCHVRDPGAHRPGAGDSQGEIGGPDIDHDRPHRMARVRPWQARKGVASNAGERMQRQCHQKMLMARSWQSATKLRPALRFSR